MVLLFSWHCCDVLCRRGQSRLTRLAGAAVHTGFSRSLAPFSPQALRVPVALWATLACLSALADQIVLNIPTPTPGAPA